MINRYEARLSDYIDAQKQLELPFIDKNGATSQWEDNYFRLPINGNTPLLLSFHNVCTVKMEVVRLKYASSLADEERLHEYYADVIKSYCIDLKATPLSSQAFRGRINSVREFLSFLQQQNQQISHITPTLFSQYCEILKSQFAPSNLPKHANDIITFLTYLQKKKCLQENLTFDQPFHFDRNSLDSVKESRQKKMPPDGVVFASGVIFNEIMPKTNDNEIELYDKVRHRFVAGQISLALAAPQRSAAEVVFLENQKLLSREVQVKEGEEEKSVTIHDLNWQCSKGFKDGKKHINDQMAPFVEQTLHYYDVVCEPARALCRFYEDPTRKAVDILGKFPVSNWHGLDKNKPLTLWQLGGLLGFYQHYSKECLKRLKKNSGFPYYCDASLVLGLGDKFALFNTVSRHGDNLPIQLKDRSLTLSEIESAWIEHIKKEVLGFPYRLNNNENGNRVRLSQALTVFTGFQVATSRGGYLLGNSPFSIESMDLSSLFTTDLRNSFFQDNGFDESFKITPHKFRHFLNTKLQEAGVSDVVIAHMSGRTSVNQNATYDHSTVEEKHAKISELKGGKDYSNIKVVKAEDYVHLMGRVASDMGVGICLQDLNQSPCTHLSVCEQHCVGCTKAAYCKGYDKAIESMECDIDIQKARLEEIYRKGDLHLNILSQKQFMTEMTNVVFYQALIELMKDDSIEDGALIRWVGKEDTFTITDVKTRHVEQKHVALPDVEEMLAARISEATPKEEPKEASALDNLLDSFGISL